MNYGRLLSCWINIKSLKWNKFWRKSLTATFRSVTMAQRSHVGTSPVWLYGQKKKTTRSIHIETYSYQRYLLIKITAWTVNLRRNVIKVIVVNDNYLNLHMYAFFRRIESSYFYNLVLFMWTVKFIYFLPQKYINKRQSNDLSHDNSELLWSPCLWRDCCVIRQTM